LLRSIITLFSLLVCIYFTVTASAGEMVTVNSGTPVFERPDAESKVLIITGKSMQIEYWSVHTTFYTRHPLARYHHFYEVSLSPAKKGWVCPEFKADVTGGVLGIHFTPPPKPWYWQWGVVGVSALLFFLIVFWLWSRLKSDSKPFSKPKEIIISIGFLVLLRWLLLLIILCGSKNIIASASDDPGYFQTTLGMLNLDFSQQWRFTIGLGILYLPFAALLHAKEFYNIAIPFANFSGFILMPCSLIMCYLIIRKLTNSQTKGFIAALLWTVMPFFYSHFEFWDAKVFKSFFALPQVTQCFRLYRNFITMGYNAMSDTPSTFFILLCILLCLLLPVKIRSIAIIAGIYSFACLIRINNILFAPLIAWLFWWRFNSRLLSWRYLAMAVSAALLTFLVVFSPQFIINKLHFSNILTFPYILHGKANDGFVWSAFSDGVQYLGGSNLAYWALGTAGLLLISDRKLQTTLILWAIPVILFFMGYTYTCCDSHRFIMSSYAAIFGGLVSADIWDKTSKSEKIRLFAIIIPALLLVCPSAYYWRYQLPWDMQNYRWGITISDILNYAVPVIVAGLSISLYRNLRAMIFALTFVIIYFTGNPFLFAIIFAALLLFAFHFWLKDYFITVKEYRNHADN
jgi:hypothetical protein